MTNHLKLALIAAAVSLLAPARAGSPPLAAAIGNRAVRL